MRCEKKIAVIHFWSGIKYINFFLEGYLAICLENHKNDNLMIPKS